MGKMSKFGIWNGINIWSLDQLRHEMPEIVFKHFVSVNFYDIYPDLALVHSS